MIPKIIHQTAPADRSRWKDEWITCHATWKKYFPESEFKHIMWHDEDLDNFIKNHFDWFYPIYSKYNLKIKKIDIARYFILYVYGGIYADMDYLCEKNFYDMLPQDKISISESPYKENEYIQNALMISPPSNQFWFKVINKAIDRVDHPNVLYSTGPQLLSDVYFEYPDDIHILSEKKFNPRPNTNDFYSPEVLTKHLGTKSWV
jgi:mannosyltransferase OCH1-like enzyme